ncbi:MAG: NAD(P)H-dependent oxidoreductase [Chlorobiaceae bacterium]|nr:NAD(P)H-dependent oxidoreductase [Chlorobiaceae bacterium]
METYRIAVIVGSLRKESLNRKFVEALVRIAPVEFSFKQVQIGDLPHFNQDEELHPVDPVRRLKGEIGGSDGLLFATPEYNRSISGVLKNALDHGSRPYGHNVWAGKPAGIVGVSVGAAGTAMAQQHLRNILACLDVPVLGQPEVYIQAKEGLFDEDGGIGDATRGFMQAWMDRYAAWVKLHTGERG